MADQAVNAGMSNVTSKNSTNLKHIPHIGDMPSPSTLPTPVQLLIRPNGDTVSLEQKSSVPSPEAPSSPIPPLQIDHAQEAEMPMAKFIMYKLLIVRNLNI